jgi:hypothetical protein
VRRWSSVLLPVSATRGLPLLVIQHHSPASSLPIRAAEGRADAAIGALDHAVVASGDLGVSRAVYRDTLGLRLALDRDFEARGLRILFFRVGGVTVEVVGPLEAASSTSRRRGPATSPAPGSARCAAAPAAFPPCSCRRNTGPSGRISHGR